MEIVNSNSAYISDTNAADNYSKGWKLIFAAFTELIVVTILYAVIQIPSSATQQIKPDNFEWVMVPVVMFGIVYGIFISGPIGMSTDWVFLKAVHREKIVIKDMFSVFERNYWNAVVAGLIKGIIIFLGFLMLIIPGIIFACRFAFVNYLIIDEKMEAIEALKTSWAMPKGYGWTIFGMAMLAFLIIIAGLLLCFVGVFISAMWITSSFAVLYHSVYVKKGIPPINGTTVQTTE